VLFMPRVEGGGEASREGMPSPGRSTGFLSSWLLILLPNNFLVGPCFVNVDTSVKKIFQISSEKSFHVSSKTNFLIFLDKKITRVIEFSFLNQILLYLLTLLN
jgi:hypothetical protein